MKEVTYEDWQENPTPRMMWACGGRRMIKQYCVRTYESIYSGYSDNTCAKVNCETLNSYLNEGWKVVMVTPKSNYNEYIIEKEVEDSEAEE